MDTTMLNKLHINTIFSSSCVCLCVCVCNDLWWSVRMNQKHGDVGRRRGGAFIIVDVILETPEGDDRPREETDRVLLARCC